MTVLKVLQLIPTLDRSGAEKQMVLLCQGLPRDRFEVEAAALTRLGPFEADLRDAGIPLTLIGKPLKIDPFALGRLTRFMKAKRFDVVQTWVFAANSYGRVAAKRAKVPVIVTAEMAGDLWKSRGHLMIDRQLAKWTDRVVGNSHAVVDFYRKVGVPENKLGMIYSGVAEEPLPQVDATAVRAEFGWSAEVPLIVFIGRLMAQKAVADLVAAIDILQHVRPDAKTLIIGGGPLRDELIETAHKFDLDDKVRFVGHREDAQRLLAAADLLVLPSLYEGLPNVVLEAMRLGKPVVATAAPGTTEVVVDGETGLLVPLQNPTELARGIRKVLADNELAKRLGEAGRERVAREFGVQTMIDRFAELYENLYAKTRSRVG